MLRNATTRRLLALALVTLALGLARVAGAAGTEGRRVGNGSTVAMAALVSLRFCAKR